nr:ulp1 protease family, C-terminal catalytic domain-containing protein [Tanacetum cinerariifolium]
ILVIVDEYSIYTWTVFLRSKDETPKVLKDFLTMIQRNLQALMITVHTDGGTEFLNKTLNAFFKEEGIEHQTSIARTLEQNGDLTRPFNCIDKVYCNFVLKQFLIKSSWRHCKFPWCNDKSVDGHFWDTLIGLDDKRLGWLLDDNGVVEVEKDLSELETKNKRLAEQRRIRFHKMKEQENDMKSSYFSNSTHVELALEKYGTNKRKFANVLRPPVEEDTYLKVLSIDTLKK